MNLAIRISRPYGDIQQWCEELKAEKKIVYQHDADDEVSRTHIHMLVICCSLKPDTLKYHYKKLYGPIEKTDWSFASEYKDNEIGKFVPITPETSDKFITYMSKGHLTPVLSVGYDPFKVLELSQQWKDPKTTALKTEGGKFVRVPKQIKEDSKKKTKRDLVEIMVCKGKDEDIDPDDTNAIISMIREVLVKHNEVLGMYKVMDFYDGYMMYACKERFIDMVVAKINSRVPKNNF